MTTLADCVAADRRHVLLRLLGHYSAPVSANVLKTALAPFHHYADRATILADLRHLQQSGQIMLHIHGANCAAQLAGPPTS